MRFKPLDVYQELYECPDNVRYISACGGRGAGRSHNCSEYMIYKLTNSEYFRGLVARAVYSDLAKTTWLEFVDRIEQNETLNQEDFKINNSEKIITHIPTGNTITGIGFLKTAGSRKASMKGFANVTDVLIEEGQELTEAILNQLDDSIRTVKAPIKIIFAFNMPEKTHVLLKYFFDLEPVVLHDSEGNELEGYHRAVAKKNRTDHIAIFSTYIDNYEHLSKTTIRNYERYFYTNIEHYYTEIKGFVSGGAKGVIFKYNQHWFKYSALPDIPFHESYSVDFGGAGGDATDKPDGSSKTVYGRILINKDLMHVYVKVIVYKGFIESNELYSIIKDTTISKDSEGYDIKKKCLVDNARKDKLREMLNAGIYALGAKTKEGGSNQIKTGYDILKKYKLFIHEEDEHAQTELNNHKWEINKSTGELTGNVEDKFKDVLDMIRYAVVNYDLYNN